MPAHRYSEEFRATVVKEVTEQQLGATEAARKYGVSVRSVFAWMRRYRDNSTVGGTLMSNRTEQDVTPPSGVESTDDAQRGARFTKWSKPVVAQEVPRPRKKPRQGRSRHLVSTICTACLQILDKDGVDALTTNRIAEVAGVGIASIYQYFPNKDAILAAVYDELLERERAALEEFGDAMSELDSRAALEYFIDRGINLRRRLLQLAPDFYQKYHREFELAARYRNPGAPEPHEDITDALAATGNLFSAYQYDLRVPNNVVTQFIFTRGIGAIFDKAAEDNPALLEDPEFVELLKDLAVQFFLGAQKRGSST